MPSGPPPDTGETIYAGEAGPEALGVLHIVPIDEEEESPFVGMLRVATKLEELQDAG